MNYSGIPRTKCPPGCAKCCGVILWTEEEDAAIRVYLAKRGRQMPKAHGLHCPFLVGGKRRCGIYPVRPFICRLYGTTKTLYCAHGVKPERWLSDTELARIMGRLRGHTMMSPLWTEHRSFHVDGVDFEAIPEGGIQVRREGRMVQLRSGAPAGD